MAGFDPIHSGHIRYFEEAAKLGDKLIVALNSDAWLSRKKERFLMSWYERRQIIKNLRMVSQVISFDDSDDSSRNAIKLVNNIYPGNTIIFANGGDRGTCNTLEMDLEIPGLKFEFGVGGETKQNSSSCILENWEKFKTEKPWGYYRILYNSKNTKVKELVVDSGKSLSMQRHFHRHEYWQVVEGKALVNKNGAEHYLGKHDRLYIPCGAWHQLKNTGDTPLKIIEIQYGFKCNEADIERIL